MTQPMLPLGFHAGPARPREGRGVVFTRPWAVDLVLDLAGYREPADLAAALAVEPAAGDGAFLAPMARRLLASCRRLGRHADDAAGSLLAYELDDATAAAARRAVEAALVGDALPARVARDLARAWVRTGDYLLEAGRLPAADFVLGNPPYIRLEEIDDGLLRLYRSAYPTMRGRADLYVAFFEAALRQLRPGGTCAFLCADRWMLNQYGAGLRSLVTSGYDVRVVVEMHDADAFDVDVSAYPAISVIGRGAQGPAVVASLGTGASAAAPGSIAAALDAARRGEPADGPGLDAAVLPSWFAGSDPWPIGPPARLALLEDLEARFPPLESDATATRVGIGVATGADDVYITADPGLVEPSRLLRLAMAADTLGGELAWSGRYLVAPWSPDGLVPLGNFPRLRDHFLRHEARLRGRDTARRNPHAWYRTIDRVRHSLLGRAKLYIPDIKDRLRPVLDRGGTYPHHNLYFVQSEAWDLEVLGALLMSDVGQFFVESYGVRMRGGYLRFQAQYLRRIRVPAPADIPPAMAMRTPAGSTPGPGGPSPAAPRWGPWRSSSPTSSPTPASTGSTSGPGPRWSCPAITDPRRNGTSSWSRGAGSRPSSRSSPRSGPPSATTSTTAPRRPSAAPRTSGSPTARGSSGPGPRHSSATSSSWRTAPRPGARSATPSPTSRSTPPSSEPPTPPATSCSSAA